jgi:hypothetical protein
MPPTSKPSIEQVRANIDIDAIKPPSDIGEKIALRKPPTQRELEKRRYQQETDQIKSIHELRVSTARKLFWFVCGWLAAVVAVLLSQLFFSKDARLSDNVLITLITTTTINVIGLFLAVTRYLFPSLPDSKDPSKPPTK